jgi:hypothetical protein
MDNNLAYHVQMFNDRVRAMNQTNKSELRLTAVEANNVLSDIFAILAQTNSLVQQLEQAGNATVEVVMDGGGFK